MSMVEVDRAVTFTVAPPRAVMDLVMYEDARVNVARLNPDQRHALAWALSIYERPAPMAPIAALPPAPPTVPARRRVGLVEAVRGVECCNPAVTAAWRLWQWCFFAALVIVAVVAVFGTVVIFAGILVACVVSLGLAWSMGPSRCGR